jgi:hypothetical protein
MRDPYRKYQGIAYRELRFVLLREGLSEQAAEETILDIKRIRADLGNKKRQQKELTKQWGEVIESLQHERKIVRGMARYKTKTPAPERDEFVAQYFAVLNTLYEKLCKKRTFEQALPEHSHWTDFVPDRIKEAFAVEANAIPPRDKAKFKEPFQRTSPMALSERRRARLLRATRATLDAVLIKQDVNTENEKLDRKEWLLREAVKRIKELPSNAHVPSHWAEMVRDLMNEGDDTETVKPKAKPAKTGRTAKVLADKKTQTPVGMPKVDFERWKKSQQRYTELMIAQPITDTIKNLLK